MKVKGTFQHPSLNSKIVSDGSKDEQEISLSFETRADKYHEFFGFSEEEVKAVTGNERKMMGLGDACPFMKTTYNVSVEEKFKFKGLRFRSIDLKNIKGSGSLIVARFNLKFDQPLWEELPKLAHPKELTLDIQSVQMPLPLASGPKKEAKKPEPAKKTEGPGKQESKKASEAPAPEGTTKTGQDKKK